MIQTTVLNTPIKKTVFIKDVNRVGNYFPGGPKGAAGIGIAGAWAPGPLGN